MVKRQAGITFLFVMDYNKAQTFRYVLPPGADPGECWEAMCEKGEHNDDECYWMSTKEGTVITEDWAQ